MVYYNTTALDSSSNWFQAIGAVNDLSGGLLITIVIFIAYLVIYISVPKGGKTGMMVASFITSILALGAWLLEFISWQTLIAPIIALFVSIMIYQFVD
jgi:hypothetical protein